MECCDSRVNNQNQTSNILYVINFITQFHCIKNKKFLMLWIYVLEEFLFLEYINGMWCVNTTFNVSDIINIKMKSDTSHSICLSSINVRNVSFHKNRKESGTKFQCSKFHCIKNKKILMLWIYVLEE